jgi:hypothetical protein
MMYRNEIYFSHILASAKYALKDKDQSSNEQNHRIFEQIRISFTMLSYIDCLYTNLKCKMLYNQFFTYTRVRQLEYLGKEVTIPSDWRVSPTSVISVHPSTRLAQLDLGLLIYSRVPTPS